MTRLFCTYLNSDVELSEERERHIADRHPDLLPRYRDRIAQTLADPHQIRRSARCGNARLFSRWHEDIGYGKQVVVVVVSQGDAIRRHWIITAYLASRLSAGDVEWTQV